MWRWGHQNWAMIPRPTMAVPLSVLTASLCVAVGVLLALRYQLVSGGNSELAE